jgi:hypothetical protein
MSFARRSAAGAGIVLAFVLSCSDGVGPGGSGPPGARVVAGADVTDTISAMLSQALVIEVRDEKGRAIPNTLVRVQQPVTGSPTVRIGRLDASFLSTVMTDSTDVAGQVAALVQFGDRAGTAELQILVPATLQQLTATYSILPGNPAAVDVQPTDTAIYVGGTVALRGEVRDRRGNVRQEAVSYTLPDADLLVSGTSARGEQIGRTMVVARSGALTDTARVSVVPRARIAAVLSSAASQGVPRIVSMELDGSGIQPLFAPPIPTGNFAHPRWSDGSVVAFIRNAQLWTADQTGVTRVLHSGTPAISDGYAPEWSADGQWIYVTQTTDSTGIWRVRADGQLVEKTKARWPQARAPTPSPDGGRLAYQGDTPNLLFLDLATGVSTELAVPAQFPRWSPDGQWIAHLDRASRLYVMRPDGSGRRLLGNGITAQSNYCWSPDSAWLLYASSRATETNITAVGLSLVNVATGEVLPLWYGTANVIQPSWRAP